MKKKLLLPIGLFTLTALPTVALVSCGTNADKPKPSATSEINQEAQKDDALTTMLKQQTIAEDGIYFSPSTYNGHFWNGNKKDGKENVYDQDQLIPMPTDGSYMSQSNVIELGDGDSLFMAFDNDDNDGLTADKFEDEFHFMDTSYQGATQINDANKVIGNKIIDLNWMKALYVGFANGKSNEWIGSQSNHTDLTFDEAMENFKTRVSDEIYTTTKDYYNTYSRVFVPLYQEAGTFTYKRLLPNIFQITYHYSGNPITAATFEITTPDGTKKLSYQTLSLGDEKEWSAYETKENVTFFARKNI